MARILILLITVVSLLGCNDEGPTFIEPKEPLEVTANYGDGGRNVRPETPDIPRTFTGDADPFIMPRYPTTHVCMSLDGRVSVSSLSPYWNSCYRAPLDFLEAMMYSITRDVARFWNSSLVSCDCSEQTSPHSACHANAYVSSAAPGFIWYDDFLIELVSEGRSLVPVAFVLAHEAGHHMQYRHGLTYASTLQAELAADCFAGYFLGYLGCTGQIDGVDAASAITQICEAGDAEGTPWWDDNAHGSCADRVFSAFSGITGYGLRVPPKIMCAR